MRYKTRIKRLKEVYYIGGSLIKKANKRQKKIRRKVRESYARIAKTYYKLENCFIINKKLYYK